MKKGDILRGSKRGRDAAYHFIIFLSGRNEDSFIGAVLTHSDGYKNNVLMKEEHFQKITEKGEKYKFRFDNSHLVKSRFIKLQDWGPFEKIGGLTKTGLKFVESETSNGNLILWDEYINGKENR